MGGWLLSISISSLLNHTKGGTHVAMSSTTVHVDVLVPVLVEVEVWVRPREKSNVCH